MSLLVKGGTVIGPTGTRVADVLVEGEKIVAVLDPSFTPTVTADEVIDATGKYVIPGGIDAHTHMELPFGGTAASDTFDTGTRAAAWGGTTTIIDFAVQRTGEVVQDGLAAWHTKADGNCHIDYAFHMILGGVDTDALKAMDQLVADEGITSFKLFMAYPGVFYSDDGQILRAMQTARENGAMIMMHAENGIAIDVLVQQALARGETDPIYHGITRPPALETEATSRAIALAEVAQDCPLYIVHLSASGALEAVAAGARRRPQRVRRDLPAVPLSDVGGPARRARLRGRQVGLLDTVAQQARVARQGSVEGPAEQRSGDRVDRPLPVLHEGPEGAGHRRLLQDPERDRRRRAPRRPHLPRRRGRQALAGALGRDDLDHAGPDVRAVPAEGDRRSPARTPTWSSTTRTVRRGSVSRRIT